MVAGATSSNELAVLSGFDCLLGVRRVGERRKIDEECGERQANAAFHW
ncbi:MAG TPA: hypothetical protein VF516_02055 [Kofleriaceae bacterium]